MTKVPESLFHYTIGAKMPHIASSGALLPRAFSAAKSARERPILWWSENPQWETTANKVMSLDHGKTFTRPSMEQLHETVGLIRFRLDCRRPEALKSIGLKLVPFARLQLLARIDPRDMADLIQRGLQFGATPTHWWGSLEPVPLTLQRSGLLGIEAWEPGAPGARDQWSTVTLEQAIALFESRGTRVAMTTPTLSPAARKV